MNECATGVAAEALGFGIQVPGQTLLASLRSRQYGTSHTVWIVHIMIIIINIIVVINTHTARKTVLMTLLVHFPSNSANSACGHTEGSRKCQICVLGFFGDPVRALHLDDCVKVISRNLAYDGQPTATCILLRLSSFLEIQIHHH